MYHFCFDQIPPRGGGRTKKHRGGSNEPPPLGYLGLTVMQYIIYAHVYMVHNNAILVHIWVNNLGTPSSALCYVLSNKMAHRVDQK